MSTPQEVSTTTMIGRIVLCAVITYLTYVYVGQGIGLLFATTAIFLIACAGPTLREHFRTNLKDGMLTMSTAFILAYTVALGYALVIGLHAVVLTVRAFVG